MATSFLLRDSCLHIMVIWVKFTHSSPFQFADSENVDIHSCHFLFDHFQFALIHGPDIPGSYAILLFTASNLASITSPIHNWVLFLLWLHPFVLSGVISPLISGSILGTYWPGEFIFQCPVFLPFHTVHRVLKARILKYSIPLEVMTNLDSILKSRDITLPTKVRLVKAMVFPVVMYGCESWTIKKAECRIDAFELWCLRRLLRESLGLQGDPTSPS